MPDVLRLGVRVSLAMPSVEFVCFYRGVPQKWAHQRRAHGVSWFEACYVVISLSAFTASPLVSSNAAPLVASCA